MTNYPHYHYLILVLAILFKLNNFLVTEAIHGGYRPEQHVLAKHVVAFQFELPYVSYFCMGSILKPALILTAAHCLHISDAWQNATDIFIIAGTPNRVNMTMNAQKLQADSYIIHPAYVMKRNRFDIAILHLKDEIQEDGVTKQRIQLAQERFHKGTKCTALGWGSLFNNGPEDVEILYADYVIWSEADCIKAIGRFYSFSHICASNITDVEVATGTGDSGGPLFCNGFVVGVLSYGFPRCICSYPNGYTDVYLLRNWIQINYGHSFSMSRRLNIFIVLTLILIH